ncbi:hypothetical protein D2Q93_02130 [Alicyclobacillaceae bacterium I2511]|nr:hypothetical protein D2Q93_02130 [Alicyclobacillaceae bacterium I2511]
MLATFATYLWSWLSGLFNSLGSFLANTIQGLGNVFGSVIQWLAKTIGGFFSWLFSGIKQLVQWLMNGIASFFQALFAPILAIINAFFFFVEQLGVLLGLLFQLLLQVVHVLLAFAAGLFKTFTGLTESTSSPSLPADVSSPFAHMSTVLGMLQLDNLAYVLRFGVWMLTALAVVRMLGNFGLGGSGGE